MTIAGGFNLEDWIILCSDTEYTKGAIRYSGPKIFPKYDYPIPVKTSIALAGSVANARQAIRKIEESVAAIPANDVSHSRILDEAERALLPIYDRLRVRQDFWSESGPQFWLLLAVQWGGSGKLYGSHEDVFNEIRECDFVGIGDTFAHYVAKPLFTTNMDVLKAITLAHYVLAITKENVPGCGKQTDLILIQKATDLSVKIEPTRTKELSELQAAFNRGLHELLFSVALPDGERDVSAALLAILHQTLKQIKGEQVDRAKQLEVLRRALSEGRATSEEIKEAIRLSVVRM